MIKSCKLNKKVFLWNNYFGKHLQRALALCEFMPYALGHFLSLVRFFGYFCPIWLMRILANANFFQNQKLHYARTLCTSSWLCFTEIQKCGHAKILSTNSIFRIEIASNKWGNISHIVFLKYKEQERTIVTRILSMY